MTPLKFLAGALAVALIVTLPAARGGAEEAGQAVPEVSVIQVAPQPVPIINDLPGRIAPTRIAQVRPRVSGIIVARVFKQGSVVTKGEVLYKIDPAPFQVQVESAQATLQRAEAEQLLARQQAKRQQRLNARDIASGEALDNAVANLAQANAGVALAKAGLDAAELNLQYADVKAPISGRIGRAMITEGALVSANETDPLATIQQLDPVYADFTQSSHDLLALRHALKTGLLQSPAPGEASVHLSFDDGTKYRHPGRLLFSEATVDATTGQITMRAEFPNPDGDLLPGMYVRVAIEQGVDRNALMVPLQAFQRSATGQAQLYLVGKDNVLRLKDVTLGRVIGQQAIVTAGLERGNTVVVDGFQKIKPGAQVAPKPWKSETAEQSNPSADAG